jgi:RNA recognition motif-containing protein
MTHVLSGELCPAHVADASETEAVPAAEPVSTILAGKSALSGAATGPSDINEGTYDMSNKLFVGGLSWDTTSDDLRHTFEEFCAVAEAKVISDRETGRSRGFGFVTLADPSQMRIALAELDGFLLDGRNLRVNEANDRPRPSARQY